MWSALASIGGSIIGGLFNKSEADKNRKAQATAIQTRVKDAKAAGIHPLAALGASVNYSPVMSGFGDSIAAGANAAGQAMERSEERARAKPAEALAARLGDSQIRLNEAEIRLREAQALNETAQARNAAIGAVGGKTSNPANAADLEQSVRMPDGSVVKTVDPRMGMDWGEWSNTVARNYGQYWVDKIKKDAAKYGKSRSGKPGYRKGTRPKGQSFGRYK